MHVYYYSKLVFFWPDYDSCTNISLNISKIIVERLASITMYLFFIFVCLPVYLLKYTFGSIYSNSDWCWSWNSNTLPTSCEELTHWKRPWCWEGLGAGGEGDDRGWDGWMASLTRCTWVEWTLGVGDGQGGLACYNSWGNKESDTTEWLNWTEANTHFSDTLNFIHGLLYLQKLITIKAIKLVMYVCVCMLVTQSW